MNTAWLVLADGSIFEGRSIGAEGELSGEVVFHTGSTGYQEIISDPSYCGQIVVFTSPHIGNVGVNPDDDEAARPRVRGLVMRDYCPTPSNWRSRQPLHRYLKRHNIVAIDGINTREVTLKIRGVGAMPGIISTVSTEVDRLKERAARLPSMSGCGLIEEVTGAALPSGDTSGEWSTERCADLHLVVFDFGVKRGILRSLAQAKVRVTVVPSSCQVDEILGMKPDGIVLSNGPGDPSAVPELIAPIRQLIGKLPLLGICLGHQLVAIAIGARTYKSTGTHTPFNQSV